MDLEVAHELLERRDWWGWERYARNLRPDASARLKTWRETYEGSDHVDAEYQAEAVDEAIEAVTPSVRLALTGLQSRRPELTDQRETFDWLTDPPDWEWAGRVWAFELPNTLGFVYQAVHGAVAIRTRQPHTAIKLASMPVRLRRSGERKPLWTHHSLVGWPQSLGGRCTDAWTYMSSAFSRWPWLGDFFATDDEFRQCLVAYYLSLNVQELAWFIRNRGLPDALEIFKSAEAGHKRLELSVPLDLMHEAADTRDRGYTRLLRLEDELPQIWGAMGVPRSAMESAWPGWMATSQAWVVQIYSWGFRLQDLPHLQLFEELPRPTPAPEDIDRSPQD